MCKIFRCFVIWSSVSIILTYCGVRFIPERAKVLYVNEKYFYNYSMSVRRYSRKSDYYMNVEGTLTGEWHNNVTLYVVYYEFLHNEYRRSFIEMKYTFCDLLIKYDSFFGMTQSGITCPLPAGTYRFVNMTAKMDNFPDIFPFERTRIDVDFATTATNETMAKTQIFCLFKNIVKPHH